MHEIPGIRASGYRFLGTEKLKKRVLETADEQAARSFQSLPTAACAIIGQGTWGCVCSVMCCTSRVQRTGQALQISVQPCNLVSHSQ